MNKSKYFYCYSNKLNGFLQIFNAPLISNGINPKNNLNYCVYERNEVLDFLLGQWDYIKSKVDYGKLVKE